MDTKVNHLLFSLRSMNCELPISRLGSLALGENVSKFEFTWGQKLCFRESEKSYLLHSVWSGKRNHYGWPSNEDFPKFTNGIILIRVGQTKSLFFMVGPVMRLFVSLQTELCCIGLNHGSGLCRNICRSFGSIFSVVAVISYRSGSIESWLLRWKPVHKYSNLTLAPQPLPLVCWQFWWLALRNFCLDLRPWVRGLLGLDGAEGWWFLLVAAITERAARMNWCRSLQAACLEIRVGFHLLKAHHAADPHWGRGLQQVGPAFI